MKSQLIKNAQNGPVRIGLHGIAHREAEGAGRVERPQGLAAVGRLVEHIERRPELPGQFEKSGVAGKWKNGR